MNSIIKNTETTLHKFGITRRYKGYRSVISAMRLLAEDESRITAVTKEIYMEIAALEHQNWKAVERNLRTVVQLAFNREPHLMNRIMGCELTEAPCTCDFLALLFEYSAQEVKVKL